MRVPFANLALDEASPSRTVVPSSAWSRRSAGIALSLAVHAAVALVGYLSPPAARDQLPDRIVMELRSEPRSEPPPPPPPPEPPQQATPEVPAPTPKIAAPKAHLRPQLTQPKAPSTEPTPEPATPEPARIVGLSLESALEGGTGPSFAIGNTRDGETQGRAAAPREVPAQPGSGSGVAAQATGPNRAATRLHGLGSGYAPPKCKFLPGPYPAQLKAQGIEGDVTVMAAIDASGEVTSIKIHVPSPQPELNEAVQRAPRPHCEPATKDGAPFAQTITFTYRFRLEEN